MEQYKIEKLLLEAREGERRIRKLEPDFRLEELTSHSFKAFRNAGRNIGFSGKVRLTRYDLNQLQNNIGSGSAIVEDLKDALEFYEDLCKIADRSMRTGSGDAEDYSIFEESLKDFRLRYGRIVKWVSEVDADKVYRRIWDMRDAADYYRRNGTEEQKKYAVSAMSFLDNVLEENKYIEGLRNAVYRGYVSIGVIARDSFMGETPAVNFVFERRKGYERRRCEERNIPAKETGNATTRKVKKKEEKDPCVIILERHLKELTKKKNPISSFFGF